MAQRPHQHGGAQARIDYGQRPMLVFWETTRACPVVCKHCRASALTRALPGELSTAEGHDLIDQVAGFGRPYPILVLTGGDCMMRHDLFELVDHATSLGIPTALSPAVTPLLTPELIEKIAASGVRAVSISLDGATAATHETIRAIPNHFDDTIAAIRAFHDAGLMVQVNTTVMQENLHEIADVPAVIAEAGADIWEVFFLVHVGRGSVVNAISPSQHEDVCHLLWDASQYGFTVRTVEAPFFRRVVHQRRAGGPAPDSDLYRTMHERLLSTMGGPKQPPSAHTAATRDGKGIVFISYDGTVSPAGFLPLDLGSVRDRPLAQIYRDHETLQAIRAARFTGRCGRCEWADLCGGSRARAYAATGDPLAEDPACVWEPGSAPADGSSDGPAVDAAESPAVAAVLQALSGD
jgi:AdoMet-dependent heme synthase